MRSLGKIYPRLGSRFLWIKFWSRGKCIRESSGSEKLKDAQELLRRRLAEEQITAPASRGLLLIDDLYHALERDYQITGKKTIRNIQGAWTNHLQAAFGQRTAAAVDSDQIAIYVVARQKAGAANATINRELAALRRMYSLGKKMGKLREIPYFPHLDESDNVRTGFVEDARYEALARESAKVGLWMRAMLEVGYTYGWRKTELLKRRVRHVNLSERTLRLDAGETKNKRPRVVEMTGKVYELLRQCAAGKVPDDYLFTRERERNGRKTKLSDGRIADFRGAWKSVTDAAGCPGLLFHDLRRSAASNMIADGLSEKQAMENTGHETRSIFDRYHIVNMAQRKESIRKMERGAQSRSRQAQQHELFEQAEFPASDIPRKPAASEVESGLKNQHRTGTFRPN